MQEIERKVDTPVTVAPYGSWSSPITADLIVKGSISIGEVRLDGPDIYWLEGRPNENGRSVVVRYDEGTGRPVDVTPPFASAAASYFNVRTQVNGYGGGAWIVDEGMLYFSNYSDGRLYRQEINSIVPTPLTPQPPPGGEPFRHYADGFIDRKRQRWIGVVEDWSEVSVSRRDAHEVQPVNRIVSIDLSGGGLDPGMPLATGHDFFSSPRLSPDGRKLAWLAWDHPSMPWHGTLLYMVDLESDGRPAGEATLIAGGVEESILQPEWSPDGTELWFISDRSGWWNLYRYDLSSKQVQAAAAAKKEFGEPHWTFGQSTYAFSKGGRVVATYSEEGLAKLALVDPAACGTSDIKLPPLLDRLGASANIDLPYTTIKSVRADRTDRVVFAAGSPRAPISVVVYDLASGEQRILKKATELADDLAISRHLADVKPIKFPTTNGEMAYALHYPPFNADFTCPPQEKSPLIIMSHGGPTSQASSTLSFKIQYWTSRGIAVLDVNYRGSSGFGRVYRDRLKENWGIVDVEDCVNGARYLADRGMVDRERIVITGGSAGGFTTLAALTSATFHDYFRAGASHYGIGDLEALARDTHKFESHYLEWLVGPSYEQLRERSPKTHIERLSRPAIFFQGEDDPIVPPNQAEAMFEAIKGKCLPTGYLLFAGESHGFRRADSIRRSIEAEHYFFAFQVFLARLSFGDPASSKSLAQLPECGT
jgi:dipeptidyl aminopeptidase/acylaminoacyl peptidase